MASDVCLSNNDDKPLRPRSPPHTSPVDINNGKQVSHLAEHRRAVNRLALSNNGQMLLSASDDETVKVWDIRRLERDVSFRSCLTYSGQSGAIISVAGVEDGQSVASASSNGSLHVWRVEYARKTGGSSIAAADEYRGITLRRQVSPGEGRVLDVQQWGTAPALMLYSTQRGGVHGRDLRMPRDAWVVPAPPKLGLLQHVVADPVSQHWLLLGTNRGHLRLWDVRFLLRVNSWQHPARCSIDAMAAATAAPPRLGVVPDSGGPAPAPGAPLVYVAAGHGEIGLWDITRGSCLQVLRTLTAEEAEAGCLDVPAALKAPVVAEQPRGQATGRAAGGGGGAGGAAGGGGGGEEVDELGDALKASLCLHEIDAPQARCANDYVLSISQPKQTLRADQCNTPVTPNPTHSSVSHSTSQTRSHNNEQAAAHVRPAASRRGTALLRRG